MLNKEDTTNIIITRATTNLLLQLEKLTSFFGDFDLTFYITNLPKFFSRYNPFYYYAILLLHIFDNILVSSSVQ